MVVTVEYYGVLRALAGLRKERLELPGPTPTVAELLAAIGGLRPQLAAALERTAVALDEQVAARSEPVYDGATVALLPPVSGG